MTDRVHIALSHLANGIAELAEALEENDNSLRKELYDRVDDLYVRTDKNKEALKRMAHTILDELED